MQVHVGEEQGWEEASRCWHIGGGHSNCRKGCWRWAVGIGIVVGEAGEERLTLELQNRVLGIGYEEKAVRSSGFGEAAVVAEVGIGFEEEAMGSSSFEEGVVVVEAGAGFEEGAVGGIGIDEVATAAAGSGAEEEMV